MHKNTNSNKTGDQSESGGEKVKNITCTIIFDGAALNRDEKIGGNIQSIKKLTVGDKIVSFISRPAIRHYLFNTLVRAYSWREAKIRLAKNNILQFDLEESNIQNCEELDAFGYMYTVGDISITRKAPVGITKAISLFPYNHDMILYSNHDLVRRGREQELENVQPDLNNREENINLYKVSFTIDSEILGKDVLIVDEIKQKEGIVIFKYGENKKDKEKKEKKQLEIKNINFENISFKNETGGKTKIEIKIRDEEKKKRIKDILNVIRNGLLAHSSGEDNTIIPLFMIAAGVKVPSPIFHSYIDIIKENNKLKVIGINDCLQNDWVEGSIYLQDSERLAVNIESNKIISEWEKFLSDVGLENDNNSNTQSSE